MDEMSSHETPQRTSFVAFSKYNKKTAQVKFANNFNAKKHTHIGKHCSKVPCCFLKQDFNSTLSLSSQAYKWVTPTPQQKKSFPIQKNKLLLALFQPNFQRLTQTVAIEKVAIEQLRKVSVSTVQLRN